ncbi:hypothetical protein DZB84_16010, partial [Bacillus sp. HNG]
LDTINVVGLGVTGKSFFMHSLNKVQDSAFFRCKALHFYFAINRCGYSKKNGLVLWLSFIFFLNKFFCSSIKYHHLKCAEIDRKCSLKNH